MFTFTDNPNKEMWNHIRFLGKVSNCKRLLKGDIQSSRTILYNEGPELEKKSLQIAMCINQAYEYFSAAEQVSINTSPVLLFYGMLSLAKALIVANKSDIFIENITYHGLHTKPVYDFLKQYHDNQMTWSMEEEYAATNGGVFKYHTEIFDHFTFSDNAIFRFKDVLAMCPEISEMYRKYYGERSKILYLYSLETKTEPSYKLKICPRETDENIIFECIPKMREDFDIEPEILHSQSRVLNSKNLDRFPDYFGIYHSFVGGRYIIGAMNYFNGTQYMRQFLHQASIDYIAMFILSICVRYKQDFWGTIVEGKSSGILGLIELYLSVVKRRYPNFILNELFNEKFGYGSPGYLT